MSERGEKKPDIFKVAERVLHEVLHDYSSDGLNNRSNNALVIPSFAEVPFRQDEKEKRFTAETLVERDMELSVPRLRDIRTLNAPRYSRRNN